MTGFLEELVEQIESVVEELLGEGGQGDGHSVISVYGHQADGQVSVPDLLQHNQIHPQCVRLYTGPYTLGVGWQ